MQKKEQNAVSKRTFIEGIKDAGGAVHEVLIVLDSEQGGVEKLAKKNVKLHSLIKLKEILDDMKDNSLIEEEKYNEVLDYLEKNK